MREVSTDPDVRRHKVHAMRESEPDNRIEASAGRSCVHRNRAKDDDDIRIHARRGTAALIGTVAEHARHWRKTPSKGCRPQEDVKKVVNRLNRKGEKAVRIRHWDRT